MPGETGTGGLLCPITGSICYDRIMIRSGAAADKHSSSLTQKSDSKIKENGLSGQNFPRLRRAQKGFAQNRLP